MAVTRQDTDWTFGTSDDVATPDAASNPWQEGLDECRRQSLQILAGLVLVTSWLLFFLFVVEATPSQFGLVVVALFVASVGGLLALTQRYNVAAAWMVAFLSLAASLSVWTVGAPLAFWSFSLVVGASAVLLGYRWSIVVALAATVVLGRGVWSNDPFLGNGALSGLVLAWATLLLSWLGLRPLQQALGWAIASQQDARARALEAERHRGELGLVSKTLKETHERLERATLELERARLAAEEARTLKAKFAAYISHELRTPLNLIIGFSEMMVSAPHTYGGDVLPPSYRGDVDAIFQSARHLAALINDVLDLSQIDAHRMALDRDDVAIRDVVDQAAKTVGAAFEEKGLWLRIDTEPNLPTLYADSTRIRQALINLLGNALRYTSDGGVTITASRTGNEVVVTVQDTGAGIDPEELPHLFQEFRQAERSTEQPSEGSGLGLAIAKRFVGLHGGWMKVESVQGSGSTFSFGLPIARQQYELAAPLDAQGNSSVHARESALPAIVVMDSDPWLIRALQRYLDGYRIIVLGEHEGIEAIHARRFSGAIALVVPTVSEEEGWTGLQHLSAATLDLPIIACSLRGGREALRRLGVADYIDKPVTRTRLTEALRVLPRRRVTQSILIVDDDPHMVRLLERMLGAMNRRFQVVAAYDGSEALAHMRTQAPDLVLLDLIMPELDGYVVLQRMREDPRLCSVPVIVVTARGLDDDAVVSGMFGLARSGGFPAGELVRCLQATLDNLNPVPPPPVPRVHEAVPAVQPASREILRLQGIEQDRAL
jgi:signal transduction histidine kinase/DNA-binding response OmpR family regulator